MFAARIEEVFEYRRGWYRGGAAAALVLEYYGLLRSVRRAKPHRCRCLTRCRQCGIFFLTDPRNTQRHDLRCPFGCQEGHRRRGSTARSVAYYQDEAGKMKKRIQNQKRPAVELFGPPVPAVSVPGRMPSEALLKHLQMVTTEIEGRPVSREEILAVIARQRSIPKPAETGDTARRPDEHPP